MNGLIVYSNETNVPYGKKTSNELCDLEKITIEKFKRYGCSNISLSLHTSMVDGFATHLPYFMDIEQEEYVPGDFLNIEPLDVDENNWFKWEDRRTFFNAMTRWGDTFKSGMLLQVCYIFQQMLLGNISADYSYREEDYSRLGIDKLTSNKEYNMNFFGILSKLPLYYQYVVSSTDNSERRNRLNEVYGEMCKGIEMRVGGFRETDANGNILREHKATISWPAWRDVEMLVHNACYPYFDGLFGYN